MSITFSEVVGPIGAPVVASATRIRELAEESGNANAWAGKGVAGLVVPKVVVNATFQWKQGSGLTVRPIILASASVTMTLTQTVYLCRDLSLQAASIWFHFHEMLHVADNVLVLGTMRSEIPRDPVVAEMLGGAQYAPADQSARERELTDAAGFLFTELTGKAARKRDTLKEYQRIESLVAAMTARTRAGRAKRKTK